MSETGSAERNPLRSRVRHSNLSVLIAGTVTVVRGGEDALLIGAPFDCPDRVGVAAEFARTVTGANVPDPGKIYLDEVNRNGSNLSNETLLNSLRFRLADYINSNGAPLGFKAPQKAA